MLPFRGSGKLTQTTGNAHRNDNGRTGQYRASACSATHSA